MIGAAVLGSTGSIGVQALDVMRALDMRPTSLAAHANTELLERQAREFKPELVAVSDENAARRLRVSLADTGVRVIGGAGALAEAASLPGADTVLIAVTGAAGLEPALAAIGAGKRLALATKETLARAGRHVMARAAERGVEVIPVDSEHSAVFQCLETGRRSAPERVWLTASGGPFYGRGEQALSGVTPEQAVSHPTWRMGRKVSVDSATLFNKGLECIEAMYLFGLEPEQIQVVIHRQSIVHALVEYADGAVIAQMGAPDMRLPIQYALTYPNRAPCPAKRLDLAQAMALTFEPPDLGALPCLRLAMDAMRDGDGAICALSAANEAAVKAFLNCEIKFTGIAGVIAEGLKAADNCPPAPSLDDLAAIDAEARERAAHVIERGA